MITIFIVLLPIVLCDHFECATTGVNIRATPCGEKVRVCVENERVTVVTGETYSCWGYTWIKFSDGNWAASDFFEECTKEVCSTTDVNIRSGPSTSYPKQYTLDEGESLDWTGETHYTSPHTWYKFDNGNWAAGTYFGDCDNDDDDNDDDVTEYVSKNQLMGCMPGLSSELANYYLNELNRALEEGSITSCKRITCFLAQVGHESGSLQWWEEIADGTAYNNRADLCNGPTDGPKYKGRGPIQLTGKCNYRDASQAIYGDHRLLVSYQSVSTREVGFLTTVWYWDSRNLNDYCDLGTQAGFDEVTYRINGGYNGKADRDSRWEGCKDVLVC